MHSTSNPTSIFQSRYFLIGKMAYLKDLHLEGECAYGNVL